VAPLKKQRSNFEFLRSNSLDPDPLTLEDNLALVESHFATHVFELDGWHQVRIAVPDSDICPLAWFKRTGLMLETADARPISYSCAMRW